MRVSDRQLFDASQASLASARQRAGELRTQALEQRKVFTPSDDPVAAARAQREATTIARAELHTRSIDAGVASLQLADGALSQATDLVSRIRELTLQAANDSLSADERSIAANEVGALYASLVDIGNTSHGGAYVFGGFRDGTPPFDPNGTYNGDTNVKELEVASNTRLAAGVTGDRIFGLAGGVDVFDTISALQTALTADDIATIRSSLNGLDAAIGQINEARGVLGGQLNAFEISRSVADRSEEHAVGRREDLIGVDIAATYLDLQQAEQALSAAVQIASQLPLPGLVGER
jgi:flagellar hook-associated protein 3 FlgL